MRRLARTVTFTLQTSCAKKMVYVRLILRLTTLCIISATLYILLASHGRHAVVPLLFKGMEYKQVRRGLVPVAAPHAPSLVSKPSSQFSSQFY